MALKNNNFVTFFKIVIENDGPMRIGDEEQIFIDKVTNRPYLPGTSIAGALKNYVHENEGKEIAEELFGNSEKESRIYIYDSTAENKKEIEERPSVHIDGEMGVNAEGAFFKRTYINAHHKFTLKFKLYEDNEENNKKMTDVLKRALKAMEDGVLRLGGHKTNGAGIIKINEAYMYELDLTKKDDLKAYLMDIENYKNIKNEIDQLEIKNNFIEFKLKCETETPILIKGKDSLDSTMPDSEQIKNMDGNYFIPGSSIKGNFKNAFKKIAEFKHKEHLVNTAFGNNNEVEEEKSSGRIYFEDIKIKDVMDEAVYNRIKIDKFTGGVRTGAILNEKPVKGQLEFSIKFKKVHTNEENKVNVDIENSQITALIIYTLKDIMQGVIKIGSGSAIGRGKLKGDNITFYIDNEEHIIDLKGNNHKNKDKIVKIMSSLN